jgi:hypothetical protein
MFDKRAGGIVASSFVAGLVCAAVISAPTFWEPVTEPYFGLEDLPATGAEAVDATTAARPLVPVAQPDPRPPVGDFAHMAAALSSQTPPERLALGGAAGPIAAAVQAQALPTAGSDTRARVEHAAPAVEPLPAVDEHVVAEPVLESVGPAAGERSPPPEAMKALVDRVRPQSFDPPPQPAASPPEKHTEPAAPATIPAPLPGDEWTDPDSVNWSETPGKDEQAAGSAAASLPVATRRLRGLLGDRRPDPRGTDPASNPSAAPAPNLPGGRLLDRLRGDRRNPRGPAAAQAGIPATGHPWEITRWPQPGRLIDQLEQLSNKAGAPPHQHGDVAAWSAQARRCLEGVLATEGPYDTNADAALLTLGEAVHAGMAVGDDTHDPTISALTRRAALAVARRVATWRAAAALCAEMAAQNTLPATTDLDTRLAAGQTEAETARLLGTLERFEQSPVPAEALAVQETVRAVSATSYARAQDLARTVTEHYLAPNVRIAVHQRFVERMLPEATVKTSPMQDFVLGRQVRGTSTVEQSMSVNFIPDAERIRFELLVSGEVDSRTVTDAGPAAIHSRGEANFTVRKPVSLSPQGLAFGTALGTASNQSQLANIQTSFDSVPLMGPLVRNIVRNQHDGSKPLATREVNEKIIVRACREVDQQSEPKFTEMAERIRERIWNPMVDLGLEPQAVAMETTASTATVRLRLAAHTQLAAHTPRPRAPADAMFSLQVHDSTLNNGCERLALAGGRFGLEDLIRLVCKRIGVEPRIPDDLPEGVSLAFAAEQPLRVECRDGLVNIRVALDAIESGRRNWYDVVAEVAYKPTTAGPQVLLEREGLVRLSGPGHQGRLEIPLRTIFSRIFPKDRSIALLPATIVKNPRLNDLHAVQAVSTDGWFALALGMRSEASPATSPTAKLPAPQFRGPRRR